MRAPCVMKGAKSVITQEPCGKAPVRRYSDHGTKLPSVARFPATCMLRRDQASESFDARALRDPFRCRERTAYRIVFARLCASAVQSREPRYGACGDVCDSAQESDVKMTVRGTARAISLVATSVTVMNCAKPQQSVAAFPGPACPPGWGFLYQDQMSSRVVCRQDTVSTSAFRIPHGEPRGQ